MTVTVFNLYNVFKIKCSAVIEYIFDLFNLFLFLVVAKFFGYLFEKIKQPRLIGEILGGMILGPTALGTLGVEFSNQIRLSSSISSELFKLIYHLGIILMMFIAGLETKNLFPKGQRRTALGFVFLGTLIPFLAGYLFTMGIDFKYLIGPAGSQSLLSLVLGCAAAVTSVPVLSRIFFDLGILKSKFCSLILSAALLDDIILYMIMGLVLTFSQVGKSNPWTLMSMLSNDLSLIQQTILSAILQILFVYIMMRYSFRWVNYTFTQILKDQVFYSPNFYFLFVLFIFVTIGYFLNIPILLSSFCAGLSLSNFNSQFVDKKLSFQSVSMFFVIPIYFAIVGSRINLISQFSFYLTILFLIYVSTVKIFSIWVGAYLARYSTKTSLDIAVTMNARGGPGIILASMAFDAKIINLSLYTTLIILAIVTSLISALWLKWRIHQKTLDIDLLERKPLK